MALCHVPSFSWCTTTIDCIEPMNLRAWGIMPSCVTSHIMSRLGFVVAASPCHIQATDHGIVPLCHYWEGSLHHACAIVVTGCTPPYVVEPMCRFQQVLPCVPCLCRRPFIEAPWCGHAQTTMPHLESATPLPTLKIILSRFGNFRRSHHPCSRRNNGFI